MLEFRGDDRKKYFSNIRCSIFLVLHVIISGCHEGRCDNSSGSNGVVAVIPHRGMGIRESVPIL